MNAFMFARAGRRHVYNGKPRLCIKGHGDLLVLFRIAQQSPRVCSDLHSCPRWMGLSLSPCERQTWELEVHPKVLDAWVSVVS